MPDPCHVSEGRSFRRSSEPGRPGDACLLRRLHRHLPDPDKVDAVHANFVLALENSGAEIYWVGEDDQGNADAVFTYDASLMTPAGAILMSPGVPKLKAIGFKKAEIATKTAARPTKL